MRPAGAARHGGAADDRRVARKNEDQHTRTGRGRHTRWPARHGDGGGLGSRTYDVSVSGVGTTSNALTRSYDVKFTVANADGAQIITEGMQKVYEGCNVTVQD